LGRTEVLAPLRRRWHGIAIIVISLFVVLVIAIDFLDHVTEPFVETFLCFAKSFLDVFAYDGEII
jgi:hypothetical protein